MSAAASADPEQRRVKRSRVFYVARLAAFGRAHRATVLDLSPFGALVQSDLALAAGDDVQLIRGDLRLPARVAWAIRDRAGLEFVKPAHGLVLGF